MKLLGFKLLRTRPPVPPPPLRGDLVRICDFCNRERFQDKIKVVSQQVTLPSGAIVSGSRRYCIDSDECEDAVVKWGDDMVRRYA